MSLLGTVLANHVPINAYTLSVGSGDAATSYFFSEISGLETEIQAVDLPDRTKATGGHALPSEFTAKGPLHHNVERAKLEAWLAEGQAPVTATYKKSATLIHKTIAGAVQGKYTLSGIWIMKRKLPDLDKSNEGEMAQIEWTFSVDKVNELAPPAE